MLCGSILTLPDTFLVLFRMKRTLNGVGYPILSGSATKNRFYQLLFDVFSDFGNGKLNFVSTGGVVETISRTPLLGVSWERLDTPQIDHFMKYKCEKKPNFRPFFGSKRTHFWVQKIGFLSHF